MSNNIRERFRERKFSYKIKKKIDKEKKLKEEKRNIKENAFKIIIFSPLILVGFIKKFFDYFINGENHLNNTNETDYSCRRQNKIIDINNEQKNNKKLNYNNINKNRKFLQGNIISKRNWKEINQKTSSDNERTKEFLTNNSNSIDLERKIFTKLKKTLNKLDNETKSITSDTYSINKYSNDNEILEEAIIIKSKIQTLLDKLEEISINFSIIEDENIIKDPSTLNDSLLIEDIINYRNFITQNEFNIIPNKLKLLNEYNYLYTNLEKLEEKILNIKEVKEKRVEELTNRDKEFKKAKNKINNLDEIENRCSSIIKEHDKYLENISNKINKIEETKFVDYKLKGFNGLISTSLKYIGLLSLSPLKGILPSIGIKTIVTRRLISEMIKNIHYEKKEKTIYSVNNYLTEINEKIYDIESVSRNINNALDDMQILKKEFKDYYFKYHLKEYNEAYKKIEKMEEDVIKSKKRVMVIRNELISKKETNKNVLKKVRKLNSKNSN